MKHYLRLDKNGLIKKVIGQHIEPVLSTDIFYQETNDHIHPLSNNLIDGNGLYIWMWIGSEKVPANLDLQLSKVKELKLAELNRIAESEIVATYPKHKQLNILMLGRDNTTGQAYTVENQVTMRTFIDTIRTKLANKEAQVNAATTAAQVGGITW